jgi:hypothetical protein
MGFEPALYGRSLMRGIIVNDEMEIETGGVCWSINLRKRRNSRCRWRGMQVPITFAIQHVQRCEQGGAAIALVIVGHGTGTPYGQPRLSAVEGLDLALFVDAGFHAYQARRYIGEPRFHLATRPLLPQHDGAARIAAHDVERVLTDIDADHGDRGIRFLRHGVLLVFGAPCQLRLLAVQEHGRTIPLADVWGDC